MSVRQGPRGVKSRLTSRHFSVTKCLLDWCSLAILTKLSLWPMHFITSTPSIGIQTGMSCGYHSNNQAVSRKLNSKYKRKLGNVCWVEKYTQCGENSSSNNAYDNETASESDDVIPLARLKTNMRENPSRDCGWWIKRRYLTSSIWPHIIRYLTRTYGLRYYSPLPNCTSKPKTISVLSIGNKVPFPNQQFLLTILLMTLKCLWLLVISHSWTN